MFRSVWGWGGARAPDSQGFAAVKKSRKEPKPIAPRLQDAETETKTKQPSVVSLRGRAPRGEPYDISRLAAPWAMILPPPVGRG